MIIIRVQKINQEQQQQQQLTWSVRTAFLSLRVGGGGGGVILFSALLDVTTAQQSYRYL